MCNISLYRAYNTAPPSGVAATREDVYRSCGRRSELQFKFLNTTKKTNDGAPKPHNLVHQTLSTFLHFVGIKLYSYCLILDKNFVRLFIFCFNYKNRNCVLSAMMHYQIYCHQIYTTVIMHFTYLFFCNLK